MPHENVEGYSIALYYDKPVVSGILPFILIPRDEKLYFVAPGNFCNNLFRLIDSFDMVP